VETPCVLIVDDYLAVAELMSELLRRAGYAVVIAATGAEGISAAAESSFCAAVIDLCLPDMSGIDVAAKIQNIPIAIVSGDAVGVPVPYASVILHKPLLPGELVAAINLLTAA
jgi:DNA-binding response OmpR family regulator